MVSHWRHSAPHNLNKTIISRFHNLEAETNRSRKEQSFFVSADEIRENGYDLSYKRYHEVEREAVIYDAPEVIVARMEERQKAIDKAFDEFKKLLNAWGYEGR